MNDIEINKWLNCLINMEIIDIGRASNMVWLIFRMKATKADNQVEFEYALHIQCAWRLVSEQNNSVLMASLDMFEPLSNQKWTEDFDWDIQGNNLFDEKASIWKAKNEKIFIKDVKINKWGDLWLQFSNDDCFDIFVNESLDEAYRIFKRGNAEKHFVMYGNEAILE